MVLVVGVGVVLAGLAVWSLVPVKNTVQKINDNFGGRQMASVTLLNGVTAVVSTSVNQVLSTREWDSWVCAIDWDVNPTSTVKFLGSVAATEPNPLTAQSSTNQFDYLASTDMQSNSVVAGDTGYSASTTPDHRLVKVDTKFMSWFGAVLLTSTPQVSVNPVTVSCVPSKTANVN